MNLLKDIPELIEHEVIDEATAARIQAYYADKQGGGSSNRLFVVFGVLGAILVGLGIILVLAHNWDQLSRATKTIVAFLPLLIGQLLAGYALAKKTDSTAWKESTAAFLFFAIGACIALIGQIYNIPGNMSSFLLTWMLLALPLVYLMNASIVSLLYLAGITYYACETGYWSPGAYSSHWYWLLLLLVLPHYYRLYREKPDSNFMTFHHWFIPLSLVATLGTLARDTEVIMFVAYFSLFGLFYLIGDSSFFHRKKLRNNGYEMIGSLGTIGLLLALSFHWFWKELRSEGLSFDEVFTAPEFFVAIILSLLAAGLLYKKSLRDLDPIAPVFIVFMLIFLIGLVSPVAVLLVNITILAIGVFTIRQGAQQDNLGVLNYGLLIITALVICRFFDTNLSFVLRGVLFVLVGVGFFAANYWMLKKRNKDDE